LQAERPASASDIVLTALRLRSTLDLETVASGEVTLSQGDLVLTTDALSVQHASQLAVAKGRVVVRRGADRFSGSEAQSLRLRHVHPHALAVRGRGSGREHRALLLLVHTIQRLLETLARAPLEEVLLGTWQRAAAVEPSSSPASPSPSSALSLSSCCCGC
jgi:hypothetical protein